MVESRTISSPIAEVRLQVIRPIEIVVTLDALLIMHRYVIAISLSCGSVAFGRVVTLLLVICRHQILSKCGSDGPNKTPQIELSLLSTV